MDIFAHLLITVIIAGLFFIARQDDSKNPLLFIIILSVIGIVLLWQDPTYITTGYNTTALYNYTTHTATSQTYPIQEPFSFQWALYLNYIAWFWVASIMFGIGEDYDKK